MLYEIKNLDSRMIKIPTRPSMTVKKKDLLNNKEILHKERENPITGMLYFTEKYELFPCRCRCYSLHCR